MLLNVFLHVFKMSVCLWYQKLSSDLEQYRGLVRSLSQQAISRTHSGEDEDVSSTTPAAVQDAWRTLSRQLSDRKRQLLDSIDGSAPGVSHSVSSHCVLNREKLEKWE